MTIAKKSLIIASFFFAASLPAEDKLNRESIATQLQVLGGIVFLQGSTICHIGNKLIKNGYGDINLDKMPSPFKTPKTMKRFGLASLPVGIACLTSPLIFEKLEKLGEQHREDRWKEKMAQLEQDQKNESHNS